MHEMSLMSDLMRRVETVARQNGGRVARVKVVLGALCNCSADHFREHFEHAASGTVAQDAALDIEVSSDTTHPHAQDVRLDSIELLEAGQME